jgi:hypothetical protein
MRTGNGRIIACESVKRILEVRRALSEKTKDRVCAFCARRAKLENCSKDYAFTFSWFLSHHWSSRGEISFPADHPFLLQPSPCLANLSAAISISFRCCDRESPGSQHAQASTASFCVPMLWYLPLIKVFFLLFHPNPSIRFTRG